VNVVNPGGTAQVPHRDYHLGFVPDEHLAEYPAHLHRTSPVLTLQGAVAHCDMPTESGPTMLLPHSQRFAGGYIAFNRPEFVDFFAEHHVQLPLRKGDAVFFNPAVYHGAGSNISSGNSQIRRIANLLQISSPFGRAMETLDRTAMVRAIYPALREMKAAGRPQQDLVNAVVATAEGYAFPTNLDSDQPIGSLAPPTQVDTVLAALADNHSPEQLEIALRDQNERRVP
jgi:ectoine hydroxylase-related dioxygenase (phytanoyl-CoA dioxygenase family)